MLSKTTRIEGLDFADDGTISVRVGKIVADGSAVLALQRHRFVVLPGDDISAAVAAANITLMSDGYPSLPDAALNNLGKIAAVVQPQALVDDFKTKQSSALGAK